MVAGHMNDWMTGVSDSACDSRTAMPLNPGVTWSVASGFLAAWLAAGSLGVMTASFQTLLALLSLAASLLAVRPRFARGVGLAGIVIAVAVVMLSRWLDASSESLVWIVAMLLGWWSTGLPRREREILALASLSIFALAVFRFAQQSLPTVWILSDRVGAVLGWIASTFTGRPLTVGASFGGLDFLIVTVVFYIGWSRLQRQSRLGSLAMALVATIVIHLLYLSLLTLLADLVRLVPPAPAPSSENPYMPPPFSWAVVLKQLLPWNLPALAAALHAVLVVVLVRNGTYAVVDESGPETHWADWPRPRTVSVVIACLAVSIPLCGVLCGVNGLAGKRILANARGQLNWDRPQYDRYGEKSAGLLGMLPTFVESLGGHLQTSSEFKQSELESADLLLLVEPDATLTREQQDRIWNYVREGGSLLVVASAFSAQRGLQNWVQSATAETALQRPANMLLQDTSISVRSDAAVSESRDWWGALRALHHPAAQSASPHRCRIVSDQGASLNIGWPARPLLVGLWGWSTSEPVARDEGRWGYQEGQPLGDLVLSAEQNVGAGRVVVLGDLTCLSNEGIADAYPLVGQLFGYLASPASGPQSIWRQLIVTVSLLAWLVLLVRDVRGIHIALGSLCLVVSLVCCRGINTAASLLVPDGAKIASPAGSTTGNRLAYIDASHLEPVSRQSWGYESLNGLVLNLERSGYLPLMLHDHFPQRLIGAGVLISIAPAQAFSPAECAQVQQFVESGGSLICMVGAEEAAASARLLAGVGLRVPVSPVPTGGTQFEPEPFGRTKADYLQVEPEGDKSYNAAVRLHAAWPVESRSVSSENTEVIAYARNTLEYVESDTELPVILLHSVKRGLVVLIGDSDFALNKNLEYVGGEAFAGGHENAHFWHWLLTQLKGEPQWIPPRPPVRPASGADVDSEESTPSGEEEES